MDIHGSQFQKGIELLQPEDAVAISPHGMAALVCGQNILVVDIQWVYFGSIKVFI